MAHVSIYKDAQGACIITKHDKVYYFTRGNKVGLSKIGPETAKKERKSIYLSKLQGSSQVNYYQSMER